MYTHQLYITQASPNIYEGFITRHQDTQELSYYGLKLELGPNLGIEVRLCMGQDWVRPNERAARIT